MWRNGQMYAIKIALKVFLFPKHADVYPIKETFLFNFPATLSLWEVIPNADIRFCFGKIPIFQINQFGLSIRYKKSFKYMEKYYFQSNMN